MPSKLRQIVRLHGDDATAARIDALVTRCGFASRAGLVWALLAREAAKRGVEPIVIPAIGFPGKRTESGQFQPKRKKKAKISKSDIPTT